MIDIHAHILPGMDDGPSSISQAVAIARTAVKEKVSTIVATPHCMDGTYNCSPARILGTCTQLNQELQRLNIPLTVVPGAEIRISPDTISDYDQGKLLTLNAANRYILLELPEMFIIDGVTRIIRQFTTRGVTPVMAHPERNATIARNPEILRTFVFEGAMAQITAASFTGDFGRPVMKTSEALIAMDCVHFMASDTHPGRRYRMAAAAKKLTKKAGETLAHEILRENPEPILFTENTTPNLRRNQ